MKKLIEMPYRDSSVIVAVKVPEEAAKEMTKEAAKDDVRKISASEWYEDFSETPKEVDKNFGLVSDMIFKCSKPIIESFERLGKENKPPMKATAEFGLSFNSKGNIYIVETSLDSSIKVSFEWDLTK